MKRALPIVIAVLLAWSLPAWAQDLKALVTQMQSQDAAQRAAAVDAIAQVGPSALPALFDLLEGEVPDADVAARLAIQKIVYRASGPGGDRAGAAKALADIAASSEPLGARGYALEMISFVAGDESVPALARLLADPKVREMARWALVRVPGKAAPRALADALPHADSEFKAALITGLGVRRDMASAPAVRAALADENGAVRLAAIEALGHIPDPASEPALHKLLDRPGREGVAARDSYLRLAGVLLASGKRDLAWGMYRFRYAAGDSEQEKCAALTGLAKAAEAGAVPDLVMALSAREPTIAGAAAAALVGVPGRKATTMIAEAVSPAEPQVRVRLIQILGRRGDPAALSVLSAAADPRRPAEVREAAVKALGEIGDPAAVPALAAAVAAQEESVRTAAIAALAQLPGTKATQAIMAALGSAPPNARPELVRVLGYRRDPQAVPVVVAAIKDADPAVRLAAIEATGDMAEPAATAPLLDALRTGGDDERAAAEAALGRMRDPEARRAMVAALEGAPMETRAALLRALGRRADPDLMPLYVASAKDASEPVALAGLQALGTLRDEKAAPTFLEAAQSASPPLRAMAVHGYLLLGMAYFDRDREHALEMSRLALSLPADDGDRGIALGAIGHFADVDSLPLVMPLLQEQALGHDASATAMAIADAMAKNDKQQALALYRRLLGAVRDRDQLNQVASRLRDLGVQVDLAREGGFVTHWWVLGPFSGADRLTREDTIPTAAVDLSRKVETEGKAFEWRPVKVDDVFGTLDFEHAVARADDVGAYAYAEVTSDAPRDIFLKIGSDDDVVCRLNGEQVHARFGGRGFSPDQDVVPARLRAGANTLLLKVLNRGGQWALAVRITDREGKPLLLEEKTP